MTRRVISGFSNPTVKALRSLRDKKHRRREGLFLAEGLRLLTDARECGHVPQTLVLSDRRDPHPLLEQLEVAVVSAGGDIVETTPDILAKITGKDNPQAVAGAFREFDTALATLDRTRASIWLVAQELRDDWRVIAMDHRGHGDSEWVSDGNYMLMDSVYDVAQLIHQLAGSPSGAV